MTRAPKLTTEAAVTARREVRSGRAAKPCGSSGPSVWLCGSSISSTSASKHWSETELVQRMVRNEELAWREFLLRYQGLIRSVIERTTRRFSRLVGGAERDEIYACFLHSLLQRDMHKLRLFDARRGTQLSTWIGLLATNLSWDHVRSTLRRPLGVHALADEVSAPGPDPLSELVAKESIRERHQLLASLSAKDKRFIELFYVQALSADEIAAAMNISVKTVYSKKHKLSVRLQNVQRPRR